MLKNVDRQSLIVRVLKSFKDINSLNSLEWNLIANLIECTQCALVH